MGRRAKPPEEKQNHAVGLKLTPRQWELLQAICADHHADVVAGGFKHATPTTPVEMLRMMIMIEAENRKLVDVNDEPASTFDLRASRKKKRRK